MGCGPSRPRAATPGEVQLANAWAKSLREGDRLREERRSRGELKWATPLPTRSGNRGREWLYGAN